MADLKISQLTAISVLTPATDVLPVVDVGGVTKKITTNQILASGGVASLASATITGAATVGTTLGVTGASTLASAVVTGALTSGSTTLVSHAAGYTGKVGIGTATPSSLLALNQASGAYSLNMDGGGYGTMASFGVVNVGVNNNSYIGTVSNNNFLIQVANSTRATFDQSGHFNLANGNVVMTTSGTGIDFSATANGSGTMTSELLNDYEEGTWTGTLTGGTTTPGSPLQATGKYTKIGRQVSITIYFQNVNTTGYAGAVSITGLPFTEDGSRANGTAACYNFDFNSGTCIFVNVGAATLYITSMLTNSNWRDVNHSAGAGRYLQANVVYYV